MARNYVLGPSQAFVRRWVPEKPPASPDGSERVSAPPPAGGNARLVNCGISERSPIQAFWEYVMDEAPVSGFRVLKNDVVPVRTARYPEDLAERLEGARRGTIEYLSNESRRRLALLAGNCSVDFLSFLTLTYPAEFPCDGTIVKTHLHAVLAALRRKCPGVQYLWFLEFQARGAPHFHFFLDQALPEPLSEMSRRSARTNKVVFVHWPWQNWISRRWFEIVGSGDDKHLAAGAAWERVEKSDGCARYVAKEAYKTFQKVVPENYQNVGRFWGCSKGVKLVEEFAVKCTAEDMRKVFAGEGFRDDGNPHSVLFGAADAYRKIIDTAADPAKVRAWRKIPLHSPGPELPFPKIIGGSGSGLRLPLHVSGL